MRYENLHISVFHPPKQQGFESTPRRNLSIVRECKIKFANPLTHLALSPIYQYRWRIMACPTEIDTAEKPSVFKGLRHFYLPQIEKSALTFEPPRKKLQSYVRPK